MSRIFHGKITGDRTRPAKPISSFDLDPDVKEGDLVVRWDHYFVWDEACIPGRELEKLRWTGDELSDKVVEFLGMGKGDMLQKLEEYMASTRREKWEECVERFWSSVEKQPPTGVDSSNGQFLPNFDKPSSSRTLARGQEVFWKYISPILTSLLHFSLVGISLPLCSPSDFRRFLGSQNHRSSTTYLLPHEFLQRPNKPPSLRNNTNDPRCYERYDSPHRNRFPFSNPGPNVAQPRSSASSPFRKIRYS